MSGLRDRMNETRIMNNGLSGTIVAYRGAHDIDVQFDNGMIAIKKYYSSFKSGKISCPLQFDYIDDYVMVTNPNLMPSFSFKVDVEDIHLVANNLWFQNSDGYAVCNISRKRIRLHRLIMNAPSDVEVDHVNRDKLDNRRSNLRICTKSENQKNRPKQSNNTSGYKGVSWNKKMNKWAININAEGRRIYIGSRSNKEDAALAYNEAAIKYHGEFAQLNLIK